MTKDGGPIKSCLKRYIRRRWTEHLHKSIILFAYNVVQGWILFLKSGISQPLVPPETYLRAVLYREGSKAKEMFLCHHQTSLVTSHKFVKFPTPRSTLLWCVICMRMVGLFYFPHASLQRKLWTSLADPLNFNSLYYPHPRKKFLFRGLNFFIHQIPLNFIPKYICFSHICIIWTYIHNIFNQKLNLGNISNIILHSKNCCYWFRVHY